MIPDDAAFVATVRSFSPGARDQIRESALRLVGELAAAHGLEADADYVDGYPVTVNDGSAFEFAQRTVREVLGEDAFHATPFPITGSEDFSYVLEQVPGAFLMVGACPPGVDPRRAPYNHSPEAVFDDAILADGTALYAELALRTLAAG